MYVQWYGETSYSNNQVCATPADTYHMTSPEAKTVPRIILHADPFDVRPPMVLLNLLQVKTTDRGLVPQPRLPYTNPRCSTIQS